MYFYKLCHEKYFYNTLSRSLGNDTDYDEILLSLYKSVILNECHYDITIILIQNTYKSLIFDTVENTGMNKKKETESSLKIKVLKLK